MRKAIAIICCIFGALILTYCVGTFQIALKNTIESGDGIGNAEMIKQVIWLYISGLFIACFSIFYGLRLFKNSK
jgi:hypothetical protein